MKTIDTTVNISLKYPITEKKLSAIIKSGETEGKHLAHIFALFADVPVSDILAFAEKNDISLSVIKKYYFKHVKKFYPNHELEEVFTAADAAGSGDNVMVNREVIQEATKRLVEKFDPARIILFGSYARGTADRHSDVDLLVITESAEKKNRIKLMTEMSQALDGRGYAKDIVVLSPDEYETDKDIPGTIARYVSQEGRLLYERKRKRGQKESKRMAATR